MADKKKNDFSEGSDHDFSALAEFESSPRDGAASSAEPEFDDFGSQTDFADFASDDGKSADDFGSFGDVPEFDEKTEFGGSPAADDFGAADFGGDEFGADQAFGATDPFDFGGPPSPESVEAQSLQGNPDEEFGDFGGDGGDTVLADPYEDGEPSGYAPSTAVDPFAEDEPEADQAPPAPEAERGSSRTPIKQYAVAAAVVAVVGYIGYSQVIPMFMPSSGVTEVVETVPAIPEGALPADLPAMPVAEAETPALPSVIPDLAPVTPAEPPVDLALAGTPVQTPDAATRPEAPVLELPPLAADAPAPDQPAAPAVEIDEFVGGPDRGGLASMKEAAVQAPAAAPSEVASLASRLDEVVRRIDGIEARVAELANAAPAPALPVPAAETATPSAPATPSTAGPLSAPLKPPIVENVVLRGVSRDIAWIGTAGGVVEVKVGDTVPGAGTVESFQNYRGKWIAVTDQGIILPK